MASGAELGARHLVRVLGAAASGQISVYAFASFYSAILAEYGAEGGAAYSARLVLAIVYQAVLGLVVAVDLGAAEARWVASLRELRAAGPGLRAAYHVLYTVPLFSLGLLFSLLACFVPYELEGWFELPEMIVFPIVFGALPLAAGYALGAAVSSGA